MPYVKSTSGNETVFNVTPGKFPSAYKAAMSIALFGIIIFGLVCAGGVLAMDGFTFILGFVGVGICWGSAAMVGLIVDNLPRAIEHRRPCAFRASPNQVIMGSTIINVQDIHRLVIRNHMADAPGAGTFVVTTNRAYDGGARVGFFLNQKRYEVSFRVDVESGGRAMTLGCGLDHTAAFGLASDIRSITGVALYE